MDTKSRSIKPALAFLALVCGINLLIFSLAAGYTAVRSLGWLGISDAFQADYQETSDFRRSISSWFYSLTDPSWWEQYRLNDKNLLYKVTSNGQTVAANSDDLSPDGLPDGYNFLLYFDGETITIHKDGQTVDIYGDGYYRGGSQWNLPGYRNMPVPQSCAGLTITMAAAKEPVPYLMDDSLNSDDPAAYTVTDSGLYATSDYIARLRLPLILFVLAPLAVGSALVLWAILWHPYKVRADRAIAWFTGKIWLEVKLVLLLPFCFTCAAALFCLTSLYLTRYYTLLLYLSVPGALWWAYFYLNDMRYNFGHITANSLCTFLARLYRGSGLSWPAGRRMTRRSTLQFLAALPFILCSMVVFFLLLTPALNRLPVFFLLMLLGLAGLFLIALQLRLMAQNRRTVADMDLLLARIQSAGTEVDAPLPEDSDLRGAADSLDQMEQRLRAAVEEQVKSEKLKLELITNVSHDLKTPLTSMVSYLELLRQEEGLPAHVKDYLRVLDQKTKRLQTMVLDVFDVSKAATGNLKLNVKPIDFTKLLRQTLADLDEDIKASGLPLRAALPEHPVWILADGDRLYRVFQNLIDNALKYALPGSRVYLNLTAEGDRAAALMQNTSREELPAGVDFTQRFVRGDQSRTDGGSGLGLSIARTFTEACGGHFAIRNQADLFTAEVSFPVTDTRPETEDLP